MCMVLADRNRREMKTFFLSNGSKKELLSTNTEALGLWILELRGVLDEAWAEHSMDDLQSPDCQPLDLIRKMCDENSDRRIDAETLNRTILDFNMPPHYIGQCCKPRLQMRLSFDLDADHADDVDNNLLESEHEDRQHESDENVQCNDLSTISEQRGAEAHEADRKVENEHLSTIGELHSSETQETDQKLHFDDLSTITELPRSETPEANQLQSNYIPPFVEDADITRIHHVAEPLPLNGPVLD